MTLSESYLALAALLDYPRDRRELLKRAEALGHDLETRGITSPLASFRSFLEHASLNELQEEYVASFDFNPVTTPNLGHHLYGDHQHKGSYLIGLKEQFARHGFAAKGYELPDHVSVLLCFLAHLSGLGTDLPRREFIAEQVLPGLSRLAQAGHQENVSPWLSLAAVAEGLCGADCKEVSRC
jgi:nitrate reductase delta subunit